MDLGLILGICIAVAYLFFYIGGKRYNQESFTQPKPYVVLDTSTDTKPYMTTEHKQGDFEQDFVFQNEGGYDPTREAINLARRKFPFDWSQLPPSSSLFQAQQALFVKDDSKAMAAPYTEETFTDIESMKVLPPDSNAVDQAEIDALKAYRPVASADMKSVDEGSVKELVEKIYGDKGLVAKVAKKANNVFEVYEVMEKEPKITYEDEVTHASIQDNALNPMIDSSEMLVVPDAVSELTVGLTPYGRGESVGNRRQDYSNYNPNLEGIFGPKMQWQQWG